MDFTMTAKGKAGHSSMPTDDNALTHLASVVTRLSMHRFPVVLNPVSRAFLEEQAKTNERGLGAAIKAVLEAPEGLSRDNMGFALGRLEPEFGAMLRDTVTPTILKAGYKSTYGFRDKIDLDGYNFAKRPFDLAEGLIRRKYSDANIEGILGGNFRRVLKEIWTA